MSATRWLARFGAYCVTLLLSLVWAVGALDTLTRPLLDLGRPHTGDMIIAVAGTMMIPPEHMLTFAGVLAGLKFMVGVFLFVALIAAKRDDAMLDVGLFVAALASTAAALPGLVHGGNLLIAPIGELMLCVIASWLAIHGRGYLVQDERPRVTRPAGYGVSR